MLNLFYLFLFLPHNIQFELVDELPKYLCQTCLKHLESAYKFKIQCEYTDQKFRDAMQMAKPDDDDDLQNSLSFESEMDPIKIKMETPFTMNDCIVSQDEFESDCIRSTATESQHNEVADNVELFDEYACIEHLIEECDEGEHESPIIIENSQCDNSSGIHQMFVDSLSRTGDDPYDVSEHDDQLSYAEDVNPSDNNVEEIDILEKYLEKEEHNEGDTENEAVEYGEEEGDEEIVPEYDGKSDDDELEDEKIVSSTSTPSSSAKRRSKRKQNDNTSRSKVTRFKCDTCGEPFENFTKFNEHKKTHGSKRYQCATCGKWFSKRYHMNNHIQIHLGEKNFVWNVPEKIHKPGQS